VLWGICGIVPGVLLVIAFALERKRPRGIVAVLLVLVAFAYSLSAIACFFIETDGGVSKFTGTIGLVVLAFVARYFFRERQRWRRGSYGLIGTAFVVLLLIPNAYWKIPLVSFTRIVYEDNLADPGLDRAHVLRTPYGYEGRLALDDGRLLIQTQYIPKRPRYRGQSKRATYSNGVVVVLEPVTSTARGRWYEIQHYIREYVPGVRHNGQRARYVLGLVSERVNMYRPSSKTLGFLVDESARVSFEDILIGMLHEEYGSWSSEADRHDPGNKNHWAKALIERGQIDLRSPLFLDRAFGKDVQAHGLMGLLELGLSPVAQDSRGNTVLHFAALSCDSRLFYFLADQEIDLTIRNAANQTAFDIVRLKAATNPGKCAATRRYFEERLTR
jgi:hypothetical protein